MKIVADNEQEYKQAARMQKIITGLLKVEDNESLRTVYKRFTNAPIEKSYMMPNTSAAAADEDIVQYTEDRSLVLAYLVQGAVNRKQVVIEYVGKDGKQSERVIEPFSIKNGMVVSWCHEAGSWRHFKPANIQRIGVTSNDFDRDEDVEITLSDAKKYAVLVQ